MKYRKLRIAFSAVCGVLCLLLVALWVRSYTAQDLIELQVRGWRVLQANSIDGRMICSSFPPSQDSYWLRSWIGLRNAELVNPAAANIVGIDLKPFSSGYALIVPDWLLILLSAALGILPWLRWRFSLRTLVIATTLFAVVLGVIIWAARN
jgi:hypothetical protein